MKNIFELKELIRQYENNKPIGAICTPIEKEAEKKRSFFAKLFSR
jgi:hypothetical protein